MSKKGKKARELFLEGYSCSQAVAGAYAKEMGMDLDTVLMISSGFGAGMGRLREVCGAVSGMFMVLSSKYGYTDPKDTEQKKILYTKIQEKAVEFTKEMGSIVCKELLGLSLPDDNGPIAEARTKEYYKKRPCPDLVEYAASIIEDEFE